MVYMMCYAMGEYEALSLVTCDDHVSVMSAKSSITSSHPLEQLERNVSTRIDT